MTTTSSRPRPTPTWRRGRPPSCPTTWRFDSRIYVDPDHARIEQATVFDALPLLAAHGSEIAEPHAYVSRSLAGTPVLVVRQPDGSVRAFLNSCRHRGTEVVWGDGAGCARRFTCPYHGWTYGTDGRLVGITTTVGFPDLDRASHGLAELPCAERHGLVWVARRPGVLARLRRRPRRPRRGARRRWSSADSWSEPRSRAHRGRQLEADHGRLPRDLPRALPARRRPSRASSTPTGHPSSAFGDHARHVVPRKSYDPAAPRQPRGLPGQRARRVHAVPEHRT